MKHFISVLLLSASALTFATVHCQQLSYLPSSLIQDFIGHIQASDQRNKLNLLDPAAAAVVAPEIYDTSDGYRIRKDATSGGGGGGGGENDLIDRYRFQTRDDILLPREPSPRKEFLEHSSLYGHQYMQGGAGEGTQRLKPDGSMSNVQVIKSDSVLPAYCNPPNPCPVGYTADDGCIEDFTNSAQFSKEYQASQECMCDTEHMFSCPGNTEENELETIARSIQNEGLMDTTLDKIMEDMQEQQPNDSQHKVVAKKFFPKRSSRSKRSVKTAARAAASQKSAKRVAKNKTRARNPFLMGDKLPVVAKKSPHLAKL